MVEQDTKFNKALAILQELQTRGFVKAVAALEKELKKKFGLTMLPAVLGVTLQFGSKEEEEKAKENPSSDDSSSSSSSDNDLSSPDDSEDEEEEAVSRPHN